MLTRDTVGATSDITPETRVLLRCIEECFACARAAQLCADACLAARNSERYRKCIQYTLDCADVCRMTDELCARRSFPNTDILLAALELCCLACEAAGVETRRHGTDMEECRRSAERCRQCIDACRSALQFLSGGDGITGTGVSDCARRH